MDPKDLRKQLEQTVNPVVDQRLEGKAPPAAAKTPATPSEAPTPTPSLGDQLESTQTPAAVAPSAPAAGAQTRGKIIYVDDLSSVPQGEVAVWGANMNNYNTGTATPGAGQAEAAAGRGDWIGIPTKRTPSIFLKDADLQDPEFSQLMDAQLRKIEATLASGKDVYFPSQGIGTGRAKLSDKAPKVYAKLAQRLEALGIRNDSQGYAPVVSAEGDLGPETVGAEELRDSMARSKGTEAVFNPELAPSPVSEQGGLPVPPQGETPVSVAPRAISVGSAPGESAPENLTTAATPSLEEQLAATQTGELRTPPVAGERAMPTGRAAQAERASEILGYDPMADLSADRPFVSERKFAAQRELLTSYKKYLEDAGLYTSTRMKRFVDDLKSSELVFDEDTGRYELKPSQALDKELRAAVKARAESRTQFMEQPHGVERKVYDLYNKTILGMTTPHGKKIAAQDSDADATAVNRGRRSMRRLGLHFLLNFIPAADEAKWGELRTAFREILTESGLPEEVFDAANARNEPLFGAKDQRSFNNDARRVRGHIENIRTIAGQLLKSGELRTVATHPDVAQSLYYLLSEIVQADKEILSGEMASVNPFAEEEYVRSTSDDLTDVAAEIEALRASKGIPTETGPRQGLSSNGANYTLVDYKNYLRGGQRRYALDIAGVIDPRWVDVDSRGLDLPIFANPNHPDASSAGDGMTPSGGGSTKASIGFNISTDPTAAIPNASNLQRVSTLEIRVNKAIKEFLQDRDTTGLLRPGTDDKTIRVASDIPYTQDRFLVGKRIGELRGAMNTGKIVIVAFPQFGPEGQLPEYPDGDTVVVDGRVFYRKLGEMVALSENDSAISKLVLAGASTTKPFVLGQQVEYPAGQVKSGQLGSFIVDIDPVVHQAVRHTLPMRSVGGVRFQGAYIPEQFAEEFGGQTQVVAEQGVRPRQVGAVQEVVTTTGRKRIGTTTELPVTTLIIADDDGNFPTVGTMVDGYVYGDAYGEDPRMYTQVADRSGPTMRDAMEQVRAYEEAIASGAPRSEAIPPSPEMQTKIEESVGPRAATSIASTAEALYQSAVERYDEYQQLKAKLAADPGNEVLKQEMKNKFPNASEMRKPEPPQPRRLEEIGNVKRVTEYYGSDVYDRTEKTARVKEKGSEMRGTISDLPPADRTPLTPAQRQASESLLKSLIVVLRHRATTANFIGAGGLNSDTSVIAETSDTISKLFNHLDRSGLYNAYFDSIIANDVFAAGLGASNPDAAFWLQRLQELPGQRPLSTRGRDSGRFMERTALFREELGATKGELTVWDSLDNFTEAVDSLYEAVADFHAQNPVRMRPNTSLESVISRASSTDDQPVDEEVTVQETIAEGEQIDQAGGDAPLTETEKKFAAANGLEVKEHPGPVSVLRSMIKYDSEVRRLAAQGKGKIRTSEVRGKLIRLRELLDRANVAVGTDKYVPGVGVFRSEEAKIRDLRKAHDPAMSSAIQEATRKVLALPIEDRPRAVDLAFNKYSQHLADDMDGDALVKVINSMLYGDEAEDSLAALIDSQKNMDITESINAAEIPQLYGNEVARIITKEELLSLSGANKSEIRRLLEFTSNRGYDIIVAKTPDRGNRIIMTKVTKDKFGKMTIAPDEDFTKRNLFTADEVNTALSNFGALDMIRVVDTGIADGRTPLYDVQLNPAALELLGDVPTAGSPQNKKFVSSLRILLDAALKSEFRRLASEAAIREGSTIGFDAPKLDPVKVYGEMKQNDEYGPFGVRRERNANGSRVFWAVRKGADSAERLAMLSEYADKVKPGSDPVLDALRKKGNAPAFSPLDPETEGLSRRARSALRNHKMGLVAGGGMLGAIAMGVGVDAAMNKAEYGDQAAADYLPTSIAMNAAFEASPLLGAALALSHSAVNKQDMARTLVNIIGSLAGGAVGGAAGAFGGPVGAFAAGAAGSMAGAGITNAIYGAVTGQGDGNYQQLPANVAVDRGDGGGAASVAATGMSLERKTSSGLEELKKLQEIGG